MKTHGIILLPCIVAGFLIGTTAMAQTDPLVEEMVDAVSKGRLTAFVQALEDLETRYTYTQGNTDAGDMLFDFFDQIGLEVERHVADHVISVCEQYVGVPVAKHPSGSCKDDHYAFTSAGYSAVTNMDCWDAHNGGGESTPHYHRSTDTVATLNLDCMTEVVQVNVASVAELAIPFDRHVLKAHLP